MGIVDEYSIYYKLENYFSENSGCTSSLLVNLTLKSVCLTNQAFIIFHSLLGSSKPICLVLVQSRSKVYEGLVLPRIF
jgi:hypothetical protein